MPKEMTAENGLLPDEIPSVELTPLWTARAMPPTIVRMTPSTYVPSILTDKAFGDRCWFSQVLSTNSCEHRSQPLMPALPDRYLLCFMKGRLIEQGVLDAVS